MLCLRALCCFVLVVFVCVGRCVVCVVVACLCTCVVVSCLWLLFAFAVLVYACV